MSLDSHLRIRLKRLEWPLICRPNTSDIGTLVATFRSGYHLPPDGIPKESVIFDLGANVGYTIVDLAMRYPDARIIALEMDKENFMIASSNIMPFKERCTLLHAAAWIEDGEVAYEGKAADAFHICALEADSASKVISRSIQSVSHEYNIRKINYLKMDIEGAERELVRKGEEWALDVDLLNIETHSPEIMDEVLHKLTSLGFSCRPSDSHWASVLAVRETV